MPMRRTALTLLVGGVLGAAAVAAPALSSSSRGGFIDVPRGQTARFVGTTTKCVNPWGQVPGGQVDCTVNYRAPRTMLQPVPTKYDVGLTLRCVLLTKWSRPGLGSKVLKGGQFC